MAAGKGDYDYDFVDAPPKLLECPVCLLTLRDPHVTSCCGHKFCQLCIGRVKRDGKPCPLCNEPTFTTFLHKKLVHEVNALVVHCPQKEVGCEWQGELGQLEQHLNPGAGVSSSGGCGYVMVKCSYQCGESIQRRNVREHEVDICPMRPIELQVACLVNKFQAISAENKLLRQELSEVKESWKKDLCDIKKIHKQELNEVQQDIVEVQEKNEQLLEAQQDVQVTCNDLQRKQDTLKVELMEIQKTKFDALEEKCTLLHIHTTPLQVPPFYFTLFNVDMSQKRHFVWKSEPFYSHPGGYKLMMIVHPNYRGPFQDSHFYVGVSIQRGEFDDKLQWPFNGKVTVQLYNQTTDKWSFEKTIELNEGKCDPIQVSRCLEIQMQRSCGLQDFIPSLILQNRCVIKGGIAIRFRVTAVEIYGNAYIV